MKDLAGRAMGKEKNGGLTLRIRRGGGGSNTRKKKPGITRICSEGSRKRKI